MHSVMTTVEGLTLGEISYTLAEVIITKSEANLAAQTAFFFDIGTGKKGLFKWLVLTGDHVMGIHVNN